MASGDEQLFILERTSWSDQAATAADVTSLQLFRDLFLASRLELFSSDNDIVLSSDVYTDPDVVTWLVDNSIRIEPFTATLKGFDEESFTLWRVTARKPAGQLTELVKNR